MVAKLLFLPSENTFLSLVCFYLILCLFLIFHTILCIKCLFIIVCNFLYWYACNLINMVFRSYAKKIILRNQYFLIQHICPKYLESEAWASSIAPDRLLLKFDEGLFAILSNIFNTLSGSHLDLFNL